MNTHRNNNLGRGGGRRSGGPVRSGIRSLTPRGLTTASSDMPLSLSTSTSSSSGPSPTAAMLSTGPGGEYSPVSSSGKQGRGRRGRRGSEPGRKGLPIVLIDPIASPSGIETNTGKQAWFAQKGERYLWTFAEPAEGGAILITGFPSNPVRKVQLAGDMGDAAARKARRAARKAGRSYNDYTFPEAGGKRYVYRVHKTGDVRILESPKKSYYPDGLEVEKGTRAYKAIRSAVHAYDTNKRGATIDAFVNVANSAAALVPATKATKRQAAVEKSERVADFEAQAEAAVDASAIGEDSPVPWGIIAGGAAALIGLALALGSKKG